MASPRRFGPRSQPSWAFKPYACGLTYYRVLETAFVFSNLTALFGKISIFGRPASDFKEAGNKRGSEVDLGIPFPLDIGAEVYEHELMFVL
jgi:hypothetical protein